MHHKHSFQKKLLIGGGILLIIILFRTTKHASPAPTPGTDTNTNTQQDTPVADEAMPAEPEEKIPDEPQPPQVPLAVVSEEASVAPTEQIAGTTYAIHGQPTSIWVVDSISGAQQGRLVMNSGTIIADGEFVVGGELTWTLPDISQSALHFTIESYNQGQVVGWLERGGVSRKISMPATLIFVAKQRILNAQWALPYLPWNQLSPTKGTSEFLLFDRQITFG